MRTGPRPSGPRRAAALASVASLAAALLLAGCASTPGARGASSSSTPAVGRTTFARTSSGPLHLTQGWATEVSVSSARPTKAMSHGMQMSATSAVYFTLAEDTGTSDALVSASSPQAGRVELHATRSDADASSGTMILVDHLTVPASGRLVLRPGGYHLMLVQPRHSLVAGDRVSVALQFRSGRVLQVRIPVIDREDRPAS